VNRRRRELAMLSMREAMQHVGQLPRFLVRQPLQEPRLRSGEPLTDRGEPRPARFAQMNGMGTAIGRVGASLDPTVRLELVEEQHHRGFLDIGHFAQLALAEVIDRGERGNDQQLARVKVGAGERGDDVAAELLVRTLQQIADGLREIAADGIEPVVGQRSSLFFGTVRRSGARFSGAEHLTDIHHTGQVNLGAICEEWRLHVLPKLRDVLVVFRVG
jgi:hypothetical protein